MTRDWICVQLGAREHYMIPRALEQAGALRALLVDVWADDWIVQAAKLLPKNYERRVMARYHHDIPRERVQNLMFPAAGRSLFQNRNAKTSAALYDHYCDVGQRFSKAALKRIRAGGLDSRAGIYFGYDTCSLEVMRSLKDRGFIALLGQIDPCRVEVELVQEEERRWSGWAKEPLIVPQRFYDRHHEEWEVADRIIVNSEHSKRALVAQGVPQDKIVIVPLGYEGGLKPSGSEFSGSKRRARTEPFSTSHPLRILFLGQVILRKGIQYLMHAAEKLVGYPVRFDIVGPIGISDNALRLSPRNVFFHGRVERIEAEQWYRGADVFILPTLSDGFALTQLEAMSHGLPVVATRNCGDVVVDQKNGRLVDIRDADGISSVIIDYLEKPELLSIQGDAALERVKNFDKHNLATRFFDLMPTLSGAIPHPDAT